MYQSQHHLMMNGAHHQHQPHQRFGGITGVGSMSVSTNKFQAQGQIHTQQQIHTSHQTAHPFTQQHPHFNQAHQNGAPTMVDDDMDDSMTEHWQEQLQLHAESRQANSPHYYARIMAQQSKGLQLMSNQTEATETTVDPRTGATVVKPASRQGWNAIDFGGQGLRAMSSSLFGYKFLEKLYLNHNKLKALPPQIGQLRKLTHLDLSGNELTELPEEIGMLTSLKKLYLFDNNIRTLPYEMGYLYRLETLGIEGNPLNEVLKSQIMKDGTKALIKYLKEEMPGKSHGLLNYY